MRGERERERERECDSSSQSVSSETDPLKEESLTFKSTGADSSTSTRQPANPKTDHHKKTANQNQKKGVGKFPVLFPEPNTEAADKRGKKQKPGPLTSAYYSF